MTEEEKPMPAKEALKIVAVAMLPGRYDLENLADAALAFWDFLEKLWPVVMRVLMWLTYPVALAIIFSLTRIEQMKAIERRAAIKKAFLEKNAMQAAPKGTP